MIRNIMIGVAALAMAATPAMAHSQYDTDVNVHNQSGVGRYIVSITITNEHGRSYQLLAPRTISPGYYRTVDMDDGEGHNHCNYVATARFNNGTYARRVIDACNTSNWYIADLDNQTD